MNTFHKLILAILALGCGQAAIAIPINFSDSDNGSASFSIISGGLTYTFQNPSNTDTTFTIINNQLLFGDPPGGSSTPNMTQFELVVTGGDSIFSSYQMGNQTASGDTFDITGPNTNNNYDDLFASTASHQIFTTPLTLLAGQTYTFTYDLNANNPPNNGITGFSSFDVAPVPVPAAFWLLGSALIGLAAVQRKNRE